MGSRSGRSSKMRRTHDRHWWLQILRVRFGHFLFILNKAFRKNIEHVFRGISSRNFQMLFLTMDLSAAPWMRYRWRSWAVVGQPSILGFPLFICAFSSVSAFTRIYWNYIESHTKVNIVFWDLTSAQFWTLRVFCVNESPTKTEKELNRLEDTSESSR